MVKKKSNFEENVGEQLSPRFLPPHRKYATANSYCGLQPQYSLR